MDLVHPSILKTFFLILNKTQSFIAYEITQKIQVNQNVEDKLYFMLAVLMKITKKERLG